jgi:hypothetical protein
MGAWGNLPAVDNEGDVYSVTILESADPLVDRDWVALMRTLKHGTYRIDGQPVPFCYPMRLEVRSQR